METLLNFGAYFVLSFIATYLALTVQRKQLKGSHQREIKFLTAEIGRMRKQLHSVDDYASTSTEL